MATISTTDFVFADDFEIELTDPDIGHGGWTLVLTGAGDELRVTLADEQMQALADMLKEFGYAPGPQASVERQS